MKTFGIVKLADNKVVYNFLPIGTYEHTKSGYVAKVNYGTYHFEKKAKSINFLTELIANMLNVAIR